MENVKSQVKQAMLVSIGLFIVGKKKVDEAVKDLEKNGLNKEEAEKAANEVLESAKKYKKEFIQKLADEVEAKNIFATKEDMQKLQKTLNDIASKLED